MTATGCESEPIIKLTIKECRAKGCYLMFTYYEHISKEEYPGNYTLPYDLLLKTDNCGLRSLVYKRPTGLFITHVYDSEMMLLGTETSKEPCRVPSELIDINQTCWEINEEITYELLQKPERYLTYADC